MSFEDSEAVAAADDDDAAREEEAADRAVSERKMELTETDSEVVWSLHTERCHLL